MFQAFREYGDAPHTPMGLTSFISQLGDELFDSDYENAYLDPEKPLKSPYLHALVGYNFSDNPNLCTTISLFDYKNRRLQVMTPGRTTLKSLTDIDFVPTNASRIIVYDNNGSWFTLHSTETTTTTQSIKVSQHHRTSGCPPRPLPKFARSHRRSRQQHCRPQRTRPRQQHLRPTRTRLLRESDIWIFPHKRRFDIKSHTEHPP